MCKGEWINGKLVKGMVKNKDWEFNGPFENWLPSGEGELV